MNRLLRLANSLDKKGHSIYADSLDKIASYGITETKIDQLPEVATGDDEILKRLLKGRRWDIRDIIERGKSWGDPSYSAKLIPSVHMENIKEFPHSRWNYFYDENLVDLIPKEDEDGYQHSPLTIYRDDYPLSHENEWKEKGGESLYRGISDREMAFIMDRGYTESTGDQNIGTEQEGLTYFSTDPSQAENYAGWFATFMDSLSFNHPGYIIKIKNPGPEKAIVHPSFPTEIGVKGRISIDDIEKIMRLQPYQMIEGNIEVMPIWDNKNNKMKYVLTGKNAPKTNYDFREYLPGDFDKIFDPIE